MKKFFNKKRWTACTLTAVLSLSIASLAIGEDTASENGYTVGLSMYSLHRLLKAGELKPLDFPAFAKKTFGITKVDVWDGAFKKDKNNPEFYKKLKARADAEGVEIFLLMVGSLNASHTADEKLQKSAKSFFPGVDHAAILGCTYLRVFLKANDKAPKEESIASCVKALRTLADYAKTKNIIIAIEPATSKRTRDGLYLIDVVKELNHSHCKLMPDFGKLQPGEKMYTDVEAMMPYSALVSAKAKDFNEDGSQKEFDYPRLMKIIKDSGFKDLIAIEYEGKNLPEVEGVKAMQKILKEFNYK